MHIKGTRRYALQTIPIVHNSEQTGIHTNYANHSNEPRTPVPELMTLPCQPTKNYATSFATHEKTSFEPVSFLEALNKMKQEIMKEMEIKLQKLQPAHHHVPSNIDNKKHELLAI